MISLSMLSDAGSPEMYPGVQLVIELLDSVLDETSSRSPQGSHRRGGIRSDGVHAQS